MVDDDPDFRELMRFVIESWGRSVLEATDFTQAALVASTERGRIGLVLLDYFMPGDREAAVRSLRDYLGDETIALCTACDDASTRAAELGLSRVLPKPVDMGTLERAVRSMSDTSEAGEPEDENA